MSLTKLIFLTVVLFNFIGCSPSDDNQCNQLFQLILGNECNLINTNANSKFYSQNVGKVIEIESWKIPQIKDNCDSILLYSGVKLYNTSTDTIECMVLQSIQHQIPLHLLVILIPKDSILLPETIFNCSHLSEITFLN